MKQLKNIANILASKPDKRGRKFLEYAQVKGGYIYICNRHVDSHKIQSY